MTIDKPAMSICQSCAAVLRRPADFGTDESGKRSEKFCRHCYCDGRFVEPFVTRDEMVARVAMQLRLGGLHDCSAFRDVAAAISSLERWREHKSLDPQRQEVPTQRAPRLNMKPGAKGR